MSMDIQEELNLPERRTGVFKELQPIFTPGALIEYTGRNVAAFSDHRCLLHAKFVMIPRSSLLLYLDTIAVDNSRYLMPDPKSMWTPEQEQAIKYILHTPYSLQGRNETVFHRFLLKTEVVRLVDRNCNIHLDFHYANKP